MEARARLATVPSISEMIDVVVLDGFNNRSGPPTCAGGDVMTGKGAASAESDYPARPAP